MITVYLICAEFDGTRLFKIGHTRRRVEERMKEFRTGNGSDLYIVNQFKSKWGTKIEAQLHRRFSSKKANGEWFALDDDDVMEFKPYCELAHNNFELITTQNSWYLERGKF